LVKLLVKNDIYVGHFIIPFPMKKIELLASVSAFVLK